MNRIILIGNGFDLAHDMLTSYTNFLDDFWKKTIIDIQETTNSNQFVNEDIIIQDIPRDRLSGYTYQNLIKTLNNWKSSLSFENKFLEVITKKSYLQNWVDIENEYYLLLKKYLNPRAHKEFDIEKLNQDFERIKILLKDYLDEIEQTFDKKQKTNSRRIVSTIGNKIYSPIKYRDVSDKVINQIAETKYNILKASIEEVKINPKAINVLTEAERRIITKIGIENPLYHLKKLLLSDSAMGYFDLIPNETLLLNFNYTYTEHLYKNAEKFCNYNNSKVTNPRIIHIHGTIDSRDKNPIIFGFGDEIDDDYKSIEKLNDNKYLENIKSIKYLETANYKNLLEFINNDEFQVFIMGHSCGISDRTLLNTMFEHINCKSIKVFYHQKSENKDNYSDIVKNISRNFNDKVLMRDKVVNKTYCEPLI